MQAPALIRALRPHQWSKNVFVLAALGFAAGDKLRSGGAVGFEEALNTIWAFFAFSLGSSAIYLFNDILDVESDRAHPEKCRRPIAAGELSIPSAYVASVVCAVVALTLSLLANDGGPDVFYVVGGYMVMNLAYSLKLKRMVLLDVFCIATGFLLRVEAGGLASGTEISHWLLLCTLFLALFLGFAKRRAEIALLGDEKGNHRAILEKYTVGFLDQMMSVLSACTIICYTMYTVDPDTMAKLGEDNHMLWSVPFVVFGVTRYMYMVAKDRAGGSPTKMFLGSDPLFLLNSLAWLAVVVSVVAFGF